MITSKCLEEKIEEKGGIFLKALGIGLCILLIDFLIVLIQGKINLITMYSGVTGLIFLVLAALFSGAFIDPDSRRVDSFTDGKESLARRIKWSTTFLLISLPSLITCILTFYLG